MPGVGIGVSEEAEEAGVEDVDGFSGSLSEGAPEPADPTSPSAVWPQAASIKSKTRNITMLKTLFIAATSFLD